MEYVFQDLEAWKALAQDSLSKAGPIELADAETWRAIVEKHSDEDGRRCVKFAEDWARLMQGAIARGQAIDEWAGVIAILACADDLSESMYSTAVTILVKCWKHGAELERWFTETHSTAADQEWQNL